MIKITTIILFFYLQPFYSQTRILSGIVTDTLNTPLENANIIATPNSEKEQLKFSISDNKGRYELILKKNVKYDIAISYIGYLDQTFILDINEDNITKNFKLKSSNLELSEIIINYEYKPIEIKQDTLIYNIKNFINGNELKMKEVLEKLPGVEVDENGNVSVNGKKITKLLVEGKLFFEGGTKLAINNIPADALDKIEVLDHYNSIDFMKNVSESNDFAMNVKLKEDKKNFLFGDIEGGFGNKKRYLAHSNLFYYSKKNSISFIGDINNIGKNTLSFEDYFRFNGGISEYLSNKKELTDLFQFAIKNKDMLKNDVKFSALNFNVDINQKTSLSGYTIFSNSLVTNKKDIENFYIQNNISTQENKNFTRDNKNLIGIGNFKLDYTSNPDEKIYYNNQFQIYKDESISEVFSKTNTTSNFFLTKSQIENISIKQYFEWHKKFNTKSISTFVINQTYDISKPINNWSTNQPFLNNFIPLQTDSNFNILQLRKTENNSIDTQFTHYFSINKNNILYTNIGNSFNNSLFSTSEKQILSNGIINDFSSNGFGNDINYTLNDLFIGLEYKLSHKKWINKPEIYFHIYNVKIKQENGNNNISKFQIEPKWESKYNFSNSESITFNYKLTNEFPNITRYANSFTLENYNVIYKGNSILENERFHFLDLFYSKNNLSRRLTINASLNFSKKIFSVQNNTTINGIEQFNSPIQTNNPETNINYYGSITKKIFRFNLNFKTNLDWYNFYQITNNIINRNNINSQNFSLFIKTAHKNWPNINFGYTKKYSRFINNISTDFNTNIFNSEFEIKFLKNYLLKFDYQNIKNSNQSNYFDIANASIRYQKKNYPFYFFLSFNNIFNNNIKNENVFSNYIISNQNTFLLPSFFLISINYKF